MVKGSEFTTGFKNTLGLRVNCSLSDTTPCPLMWHNQIKTTTNVTEGNYRSHFIPHHISPSLKQLNQLKWFTYWNYLFVTSSYFIVKRDKNAGLFLVRSSLQTDDRLGTFKCARARCSICPFMHNVEEISESKRWRLQINLRTPPPTSRTA